MGGLIVLRVFCLRGASRCAANRIKRSQKMMRAIHRLRHVGGLFVALVFALSLPLVAHAVTNTWSAAGNLITPREGHTATLLPSGQVLVAGGYGSSAALASAERYDPATNTWSAAGSLTTARIDHTATLLPSGQVLVAGGFDGSGALASAERYDPATNTWSPAGSLTTARYIH